MAKLRLTAEGARSLQEAPGTPVCEGRVKNRTPPVKGESNLGRALPEALTRGYRHRRVVMKMYSALRLTWRKGLLMAGVFAGLLLAHAAIQAVFGVQETILFLGASLIVPIWAIAAAVYTFDNLMIPRGRGWRSAA